jgi:poly(3-hydroxyoctanoate) depolymerase
LRSAVIWQLLQLIGRGWLGPRSQSPAWRCPRYIPLLRQPVLLIAGDDPIVLLANVRLLTALLRNASSHIVYGGAHSPYSPKRDQLTSIVHRFLTEGEPSC